MTRFLSKVQALALSLGAPGLFLITFLDSSFLSFPEATDLLVVWMVTEHKARALLYVAAAVVGSVTGCLALFAVGQKGGEALVRSRFEARRVDRALAAVRRHGGLTVFTACLLPPPTPFKLFVLLAGAAEIGIARFSLAIAMGRGIRYLGLALLAIRYGDRALAFVHAHNRDGWFLLAAVVLAGLAASLVWGKAQRRKSR